MSDSDRAVILFAHGARDARWSHTLELLADAVRRRRPAAFVAVAYLEFQPPTLADILQQARAAGCSNIDVVPVFWASGGHVASDVAPLIEAFRAAHPQVSLTLLPVLSELPGMLDFIADSAVRLTRGG